MQKWLIGLIPVVLLTVAIMVFSFFGSKATPQPTPGSIYDFSIQSLDGRLIDFSIYRGKPLLIVNTASQCGFTPQYADLQKLHEQYGNLVTVLGFPANNFLWQEPGTNKEIAAFCERNYGVRFTLFEKISVKGKNAHPLYQWLKARSGKSPSWNFCKYLISSEGEVLAFYPSRVNPLDEDILKRIRK